MTKELEEYKNMSIPAVATFNKKGEVRPLRIRLETPDQDFIVVDLDTFSDEAIKQGKLDVTRFLCKGELDKEMHIFELLYVHITKRWYVLGVYLQESIPGIRPVELH